MEIQISYQLEIPGLKNQKIRSKLVRILEDLDCPDKELSVLFTGDTRIAQLNRLYLGRNGATNVLAFPMCDGQAPELESPMLGDVVISVDTALRESRELGENIEETIVRLLVHGVLHLLGYDHENSIHDAQRMEKEERRLIELIQEG